MKILLLGGTHFLGRHTVDSALARGHAVTVFNRGNNNAGLSSAVEVLTGDRDGSLQALRGRVWDAVIDTSGYIPRVVKEGAELLAAARHYTFVSTLSVYADFTRPRMDETAPVHEPRDPTSELQTDETYGALKLLCEREVQRCFPGRAAILRSGLLVGPRGHTGPFTHWVKRVARGGEVLAPGRPDQPLQFIDVRDVADWMIRLAEQGTSGVFNATGPALQLTMREFLESCRRVSGSDAQFVWADDEFLARHGVRPSDIPLYLLDTAEHHNHFDFDMSRAIDAGLRLRPLADSIRATLEWTEPAPRDPAASQPAPVLSPEREAELLDHLRRKSG